MQISSAGLALIKQFEGLRLTAYQDSVWVWTIGYGHTEGVQAGDKLTEPEADWVLREDAEIAEAAVSRHVTVPLTQGQFDALTSFVFNLGANRLAGSTLLRKLNAGDYAGARSQLLTWVYAGGKKLDGLVKRRGAEFALWGDTTADFSDVSAGSDSTGPATSEFRCRN